MPELTRHLLFHLYPLREGQRWRWHAEQLRQRIGLFNGQRILAVATDERTESYATVCQVMGDLFSDGFTLANDPQLREVATFEKLLGRVATTDPGHVCLYAQGKGVTRPTDPAVCRWAEVLYETCLDHWPRVEALLSRYPLAGPFKKLGLGWPKHSASAWHYSGSWCWFRAADVFVLPDWRRIDPFWAGIEAWPSLHFDARQAGALFHENSVRAMRLSDAGYWKRTVEREYAAWKKQPDRPAIQIELGGGRSPKGGDFINVDQLDHPAVDVRADITRLPFDDDAADQLYTSHTLEHLEGGALNQALHEIVRVCRIGAAVEVRVPHWNSSMALCPGHAQTFCEVQIRHWCQDFPQDWFPPNLCKKRLRHLKTERMPSGSFAAAKKAFPRLTAEQILQFVPDACHEYRFFFEVVAND